MPVTTKDLTWYAGPTIWSQDSVIEFELTIDLGIDPTVASAPSLNLAEALATLGIDQPSAFDPDCSPAHLFVETFLLLQRSIGLPASFASVHPESGTSSWTVIAESHEEVLGEAALRITKSLFDAAMNESPPPANLTTHFQKLGQLRQVRYPSGVATAILAAAEQRGIPWSFTDPRNQLIELGNGSHRQRIDRTVTSSTSLFGRNIAQAKDLTSHYLRNAGLPVPAGGVAGSADRAIQIADSIGYPVTVKPVDGGASAGVTVGISTAEEIEPAFDLARDASPRKRVLVERSLEGQKLRVAVVNGAISSIINHCPAAVTGDGITTIRELIEQVNTDPRRGPARPFRLRFITIDDDLHRMLALQGLDLDSVPPSGACIQVKSRARTDEGGTAEDVTDLVHPDTASMLIQSIAIVGLDVATIDFIAEDITRSCWEQECGIIDINVGSGFWTELNPAVGEPRDPGPAIINMLFPPGQPVRAPILAVTGTSNLDPIVKAIGEQLSAIHPGVSMATTSAIHIDGVHLRGVDASGTAGARKVLANPATRIAVLAVGPETIVDHGLGFGYCDIAVITGVSNPPFPGFAPPEAVLCRTLDPNGIAILDADAPGMSALLPEIRGRIIYTSIRDDNPLIADHLASGGDAILIEQTPTGPTIIHRTANTTTTLVPTNPTLESDLDCHLMATAATFAFDHQTS